MYTQIVPYDYTIRLGEQEVTFLPNKEYFHLEKGNNYICLTFKYIPHSSISFIEQCNTLFRKGHVVATSKVRNTTNNTIEMTTLVFKFSNIIVNTKYDDVELATVWEMRFNIEGPIIEEYAEVEK